MRIAIVSDIDSDNPYGTFQRVKGIALELDKYCEVSLLGVNCEGIEISDTISIGTRPLVSYYRQLYRNLASISPHIIYAHRNLPSFVIASLRSVGLVPPRVRVVYDFHSSAVFEYTHLAGNSGLGPDYWLKIKKQMFIEEFILRQKDPYIAVSNRLKSFLLDKYNPRSPIYVVPNGAPEEYFVRAQSEEDPYPQDAKSCKVLLVAPGNFRSNDLAFDVASDVGRILKAQYSNTKIYVVGGCREVVKDSNFEVLGFVDNIISYIDYADICLLPYPEEAVCGGVRTKSIEFLARKRIVVTTREGIAGINELEHGESVLLSPSNPEHIAEMLIRISNDIGVYRQMAERGYEIAKKHYSYSKIAQRVHQVFLERSSCM